jgi:histidyl-tRNA synthetase
MKKKVLELLALIYPDLEQLKNDYFIIGSCAMLLSDITVPIVTDLDLLMSSTDADTLKHKWSHKMRKAFSPENQHLFRSNFGRFDFGELDVEVMGDLEVCKNNEWLPVLVNQTTDVSINEMRIKIPTLAEQKRIFLLFGRKKDVAKAEQIEMYQNDK